MISRSKESSDTFECSSNPAPRMRGRISDRHYSANPQCTGREQPSPKETREERVQGAIQHNAKTRTEDVSGLYEIAAVQEDVATRHR